MLLFFEALENVNKKFEEVIVHIVILEIEEIVKYFELRILSVYFEYLDELEEN